ncbi:MAG: hypothetical protein K1X88_16880 [Nannocystaceae bacterium]|nr:hypothetical protein [Nannocystaceae bacterium]
MRDDGLQLTWSVREAGDDDAAASRVLTDLSQFARDACAGAFPEDAGYSMAHVRLWGALEGATTKVRRGRFEGMISVQRFRRPPGEGVEFRVVAVARHTDEVALARVGDAAAAHWGVVGFVAGATGIGIAVLHLLGMLSTWGQLMALVPALMAWRMAMAMRFASELRRDAQQRALPEGEALVDAARMRDDLVRWRRVLEDLAAQRDAVVERFGATGFRSPGALPGTIAALASLPVEHRRPPRALPVPDLAMPPLGRSTAL